MTRQEIGELFRVLVELEEYERFSYFGGGCLSPRSIDTGAVLMGRPVYMSVGPCGECVYCKLKEREAELIQKRTGIARDTLEGGQAK